MSNTALYHESLSLTEALMNYRHQPIYRRLRRLGKRESTLHPDVLQRRGVGKRLLRKRWRTARNWEFTRLSD